MNSQVVRDFVEAINEHDLDKIISYLTEDHKFVNAHGKSITGRENMKGAWKGYFQFFPDYNIEIEEITENDSIIGIFGISRGTHWKAKKRKKDSSWELPGAWKAVIENDKIKLWEVYCDTKVPYDIIESFL